MLLILRIDAHAAILRQRHELKLLHPIDNPAHNLADDGGLLDQDEVARFTEFDVSKDSVHSLGKFRVLFDVSVVLVNLLVVNILEAVQLKSEKLRINPEENVVSNQRNAVIRAMKLEFRVNHFPRVIRSCWHICGMIYYIKL